MIDLHMHTVFSDGALIPSELARRAESKGLTAIAITDHGDLSNIDFIVPRIASVAKQLKSHISITVIPGIEITHVPPSLYPETVSLARRLGARIVVAHGETIVEPVAPGTNRAAIEAGVDILAHPGLISETDAAAAAAKGIYLEISARKGHSLTNGHVARMGQAVGAKLIINTDSHEPGDLIDTETARSIVLGAGLTESEFAVMEAHSSEIVNRLAG